MGKLQLRISRLVSVFNMKKESPLPKNVFYDINKLPKEFGIIIFPISMSRAGTSQSPNEYLKFLRHLSPSKVADSKIGANILYGDYLYLHSKESSEKLSTVYAQMVVDHKNGFRNMVRKHRAEFQIQHAFSFQVWNDQYLQYDGDFFHKFIQFKKLALKDKKMMQYIKEDCKHWKFKMTNEQLNFYLEEHLIVYLTAKGQLRIPNEYIQDRQKWVLWAYPGVQPKALVYTFQKDFFQLSNSENTYENCLYDLEAKKLIDFTRIDLDTYNYKYE